MEKNRPIASPKLLLKKDRIQVVRDTVKVSTITSDDCLFMGFQVSTTGVWHQMSHSHSQLR